MYLVFDSDFWVEYFNKCTNLLKTEKDQLRYMCFQNTKNIMILSGKYLSFLEILFPNNHKHNNEYTALFLEIMDNLNNTGKFLDIPSNPGSTDITMEINHLINSAQTDLILLVTENGSISSPHSINLSNSTKANFDWVMSTLAAYGYVDLNYKTFSSDTEIEDLFNKLFSFPIRNRQHVYYFDRFTNIDKHSCFASLLITNPIFLVYTYGNIGKRPKTKSAISKMKHKFQISLGSNTQVYYTHSNEYIHERRIMFNNLIISPDHDFAQLKVTVPAWRMTITYSTDEYNVWLGKTTSGFTEIL